MELKQKFGTRRMRRRIKKMGIKLSTTNKNENHKNTIENQNVSEKNKRMRIETKSGREIG